MTVPMSEVIYYFKENLAYTEDHVLVKNLVFKCAENLEAQLIQKHFETFGCVVELHLFPSEDKKITGYVLFENALNAANVLKRELHKVNKYCVTVQPNYSWFQPDADKLPDNFDPNETAGILKLNDYCLEHIFQKLSITDRIHFARTCYRFQCIYEGMSPMLDKCIDFQIIKEMTALELHDFFQLSGRYIKQIIGEIPDQYFQLGDNKLKMFANLKSLQSLEIMQFELNSRDLQVFEHLSQLKKLRILDLKMESADHLNYLPKSIESFSVDYFEGWQHSNLLVNIFDRLPLLRELHIPHNTLESPCVEQLINDKCCESLEILSIGCDDFERADYHQRFA
ncbi:uncharacterized protein LOC117792806 [Drosophila innubila]|uniref:uncharacterized protein LOC117792806 n=1 Tax=Drosophila innubila TaxID=198719 RepID=UPI00148C59CF|nr:uncharacterized protein LOC117792806 [Drosophila innubila]